MPDIDDIDFEKMRPPTEGPELIIGLVGAIAAGQDDAAHHFEHRLEEYDYDVGTEQFRLRDRIEELPEFLDDTELVVEPEDERIRSLQEGGNEIRKHLGRNDALALLTCLNIREYREKEIGSRRRQVPRQAYILNSLKTPAEVDTLRSIYGRGFLLVAVYAPRQARKERLAQRIARDRHDIDHYEIGDDPNIPPACPARI